MTDTALTYKDGLVVATAATPGQLSDGYHTIDELYAIRHALFISLARSHPELSWRAREHGDGKPMYPGRFLAGMELPLGQITFHMPERHWRMLDFLPALTVPPTPYDGHTLTDVIDRLMAWSMRRITLAELTPDHLGRRIVVHPLVPLVPETEREYCRGVITGVRQMPGIGPWEVPHTRVILNEEASMAWPATTPATLELVEA